MVKIIKSRKVKCVVAWEILSTSTPKDPQKIIITVFVKETLHGSLRGNNLTSKAIDQIDSSEKSLIPKLQWHGFISKERQTNLDNMSMFALSWIILLMCMRTQKKMTYAYMLEKGIKFLILSSPISLHSNNFLIKESQHGAESRGISETHYIYFSRDIST
jgi:hypothetical protein